MKDKVFNIELECCTPLVVNVLHETEEYASVSRLEFITPELLFYRIARKKEFILYGLHNGLDTPALLKELQDYIGEQDRLSDDEEHGRLSNRMKELLELLAKDWKASNPSLADVENIHSDEYLEPISIPDLLYRMSDLDSTFAQYLTYKYLGEDSEDWYGKLRDEYSKDIEVYRQNHALPKVEAEEDVSDLSEGELDDRLASASQKFIHALNVLTGQHIKSASLILQGQSENEEQEEPTRSDSRKREPWESFLTLLNETYMLKNPLIGREKELERAIRILCRRDKNNLLFVGEPGVGKTVLIYGLTRMIEERRVPFWLQDYRVYALDLTSLVAGSSFHGEFEKRMKTILEGAKKSGNCIIYIDEIHALVDNGGNNGSVNAGEILKPYLESGDIRFIGTTTYQDYNKSIASRKPIARRFGVIDVKEPSPEETIRIVEGLIPIYERYHEVKYTAEAIRYAVEQSHALIHDRFLPDKAIDLIDEAGAYLEQHPLLNKEGKPKASRYQKVGKELVKTILVDVCRIDAKALASQSNKELKDLDKRIAREIYGQDDAIRQVVRSVMMSKAGLGEPDKPLASLLFVGPTGVGKTEVCRVLAKELGVELVRFDMSEYTEKHTVSKLIGSPAGYVGYDEGGLLTDAIRKTPNCVLLLDEIEKAHSDIYNILLQVMDYARLTDNKGNKADFRNVILIMTSNAGAQFATQASVGFGTGQSKGQAMLSTVKRTFKPEFLNRLSGTVVFNDMDRQMASLILDKKLRQLEVRLQVKNVEMTLTPEAHEFLLEKGFTTQYGAREMDRVIQQYLTPTLMEEILFGKLRKGGKACIGLSDGKLKMR